MIYDLQKASMGKRISAFLFDMILVATVAVGIIWAIFSVMGGDRHSESCLAEYNAVLDKYQAEYGIEDIRISGQDKLALSEEDSARLDEALAAVNDEIFKSETFTAAFSELIGAVAVSGIFGILIAFVLLELVVPLIIGNGQTLGKKIFGIAVMFTSGIKISPVGLFVRTVLGKYTVETMVPIFIIAFTFFGLLGITGTIVLALLLLFEAGLLIFNKSRPMIHDALAMTVCVDISSQLIFANEEELLEYKKRVHAEAAERAAVYKD